MRKWQLTLTVLAAATLLTAAARAQSGGGYDLSWWTIDGGGITFAAGGTFDLGGTVGQPDASNALTGGAFSLTGGFWFTPACIALITAMWTATAVWTMRTYLAVLFAFGNTGSGLGRVDTNCDGVVDDADLLQVLFNFGSGC
jgi:hypothetical protein